MQTDLFTAPQKLTGQKLKVMAYLRAHGSITPLEAADRLQVWRLAARIEELRRMGYQITTGKQGRVARYEMEKG